MAIPKWKQIAEDLREEIESAETPGEGESLAIPTELELQDRFNASRNTVRDAIRWLIARGLVETRPGQGTFKVQKIDPLVTTLSTETGAGPRAERAAYRSE